MARGVAHDAMTPQCVSSTSPAPASYTRLLLAVAAGVAAALAPALWARLSAALRRKGVRVGGAGDKPKFN